jgi:hypothetical protein
MASTTSEKNVLDSIEAISLLTIMEIVGPLLLLAVLIYGTLQWSRRRRGPTQAVREASTRELYREGDEAEKREEAGLARENSRIRPQRAGPIEMPSLNSRS